MQYNKNSQAKILELGVGRKGQDLIHLNLDTYLVVALEFLSGVENGIADKECLLCSTIPLNFVAELFLQTNKLGKIYILITLY
jgi:hypothetical protein